MRLIWLGCPDRFNPETSNPDFLVDFDSNPRAESARRYLGLLFGLQDLFSRDVDLVETAAIRPSDPTRSMNTVTLQLSADTEQKLRGKARKLGQTLEIYLQQLIDTAVTNATIPGPAHRDANERAPVANESEDFPKFISRPKLMAHELEHLLDHFRPVHPARYYCLTFPEPTSTTTTPDAHSCR